MTTNYSYFIAANFLKNWNTHISPRGITLFAPKKNKTLTPHVSFVCILIWGSPNLRWQIELSLLSRPQMGKSGRHRMRLGIGLWLTGRLQCQGSGLTGCQVNGGSRMTGQARWVPFRTPTMHKRLSRSARQVSWLQNSNNAENVNKLPWVNWQWKWKNTVELGFKKNSIIKVG